MTPPDEPVKPLAVCFQCERKSDFICDDCAVCLLCCNCDDTAEYDDEEEEDDDDDTA